MNSVVRNPSISRPLSAGRLSESTLVVQALRQGTALAVPEMIGNQGGFSR